MGKILGCLCVSDDQCEATLTSGWEMTPTFTVRKLKLREVKSLVGGGTLALLGSRACLSVRVGGSWVCALLRACLTVLLRPPWMLMQ